MSRAGGPKNLVQDMVVMDSELQDRYEEVPRLLAKAQ
jgi:hypothetical protein